MNSRRPQISSLDNPLYYLENFRTVLNWVSRHHGDLLDSDEQTKLQQFGRLSTAAQGLLARLVMRRGNQFRVSKLSYPELGLPVIEAVSDLEAGGWLNLSAEISLEGLFSLFTRAELQSILSRRLTEAELPRSCTKVAMLEALQISLPEPRSLQSWSPGHGEQVVELSRDALFQRVRLMFFGNLRQDWTEFVLAELGYQQYETVPFKPESRAFQSRGEVDLYLHMSTIREALDAGVPVAELYSMVPALIENNDWLEHRRGRLLYTLGHMAERQGQLDLALQIYAESDYSDALVRRLRVMERARQYEAALPLAREALANPQNARQLQAVERVYRRISKKLGLQSPASPVSRPVPEIELYLPRASADEVELAVANALNSDEEVFFYVENWLFNGLFGLLCWPALFAPLRGAFFHPFHAAPVDLYRPDFVSARRELFDACLSSLDSGDYRERIRTTWQQKQGTACSFVYWPLMGEQLLELALACIPAIHLRQVFDRMLLDLRDNRAGIPDLVGFSPAQKSYRLLEVKAPGDRLQDNQKRWFEYFLENNIPAAVCYVRWQD